MDTLVITMPQPRFFYRLCVDGGSTQKELDKSGSITKLFFSRGEAVFLYYTYPTHRRVYLIRNDLSAGIYPLPGLSKKVSVLFTQYASKVDKVKKTVAYLNACKGGAYRFSNLFYYRLDVILKKKGPVNYLELDALCEAFQVCQSS
jgi:hypothetical protein